MEEAIWEASRQQYLIAAQCWAHLAALILPMFGLQWLLTGRSALDPLHCLIVVAAWAFYYFTVTGVFQLSPFRLRLCSFGNFLLLACFAQQEVQNPSYEKIATITAVKTAGRLANAALFVDIKTSIPIQLMISLLEVRSAWQQNPNSLYLHFLLQMNVSLIVLAVSGLLEISVRSRIAMLLDSESMVSSFRKMLRGVCDGEVLLDSDFKISGKADCLKTILMTGHDFSGQDFEKLLVEEERERFRTFMKEPLAISTPSCLRVSLKRGRIRVGVDLFHVKVPHLFGKAIHHLVALREDAESRLRQEATDAYVGGIPSVLAESGSPKSRSKRSKSAISASSAQACAMLQLSNELQEMTLLIDAATPMLDVAQAHLSFTRKSSDADSSMPSLRKIVLPTDWGSVRDQLVNFGERQSEIAVGEREVLKTRVRLQDGKMCVQARKVEVSVFSPTANGVPLGLRLHMHLSRFKPMQPGQRHQSSLPGLFEFSEDPEECSYSSLTDLNNADDHDNPASEDC